MAKDSVVESVAKSDLSKFRNIEIIEYCVSLPLNDYKETFSESMEKAQHAFVSVSGKDSLEGFTVKGFLIDPSKKAADYYKRDLSEMEESGLVVESSFIDGDVYCIKGHLANLETYHFTQIMWVKEDKVGIDALYPAAMQSKWDVWAKEIIKNGITRR